MKPPKYKVGDVVWVVAPEDPPLLGQFQIDYVCWDFNKANWRYYDKDTAWTYEHFLYSNFIDAAFQYRNILHQRENTTSR